MEIAPMLRRALARSSSGTPARLSLVPGTLHTAALVPPDEVERLSHLADLRVMDSPAEDVDEGIVQLAAQICGTPMAALTFVDAERQWYRARVGIPVPEVARGRGFCAWTISDSARLLEISDTAQVNWFDARVHGPSAAPVRFYAGVPLRTREGSAAGTLCVMDSVPRTLTTAQRAQLETLARTVSTQLKLRQDLRIATRTDRLTGLPNWLQFEGQFEAAKPARGVVCFVRMRALSQINSAHGFRVGDALLTQAGVRLRRLAQDQAFIGRIKRGLFLLF